MDLGITQKLAHFIVRPPRTFYQPKDLGRREFEYKNRLYEREDFTVVNSRGKLLQCSIIKDSFAPRSVETVVILHANGSSRLTMKNYLSVLLPHYDVLSFDFAGCGRSEGKFVSLGYKQKEDVYAVISEARERYGVKNVILWGRSMGAATALLYTAKYQGVKAIVSDNCFCDLEEVAYDLADDRAPILPGFVLGSLMDSVQEYISQHVCKYQNSDFNLRKLKPVQVIDKITCPIFYIGSTEDTFVNVKHTKRLYEKTKGIKRIELVKGDHNDLRSDALKQKVLEFLKEPGPQKVEEKPSTRVHIFTSRKYSTSRGKSRGHQSPRKPSITEQSTPRPLRVQVAKLARCEQDHNRLPTKQKEEAKVTTRVRTRSRRTKIFQLPDQSCLMEPSQSDPSIVDKKEG